MRRDVGLAAIALSLVAGILLSHGCVDDRAKVRSAVFLCNPATAAANNECGSGFTCYSAAQSFGSSVCVPSCDPKKPQSCYDGKGACTQAGDCLMRCTVPLPDGGTSSGGAANPCPAPLQCRRITDMPLERAMGPDGVCLPVNLTCSSSGDCNSAIFDTCASEITGASDGQGLLLTSGEVCVEGRCSHDGIACEPGSACIKDILPATIPAPDVCSPVCSSIRDRKPGSIAFNECAPGLTCLSDAFPQTRAGACAPGFPGWICVDQVGCAVGACEDWADVDPFMSTFLTCTPHCNSDSDCIPFDRGTNPNIITHFTCQHTPDGDSWCRNMSSLFFPLTCLHEGDACGLDPDSRCVGLPPTAPADMAGQPPACGGNFNNGAMGLGAFGGAAASCRHGCKDTSECQKLASATHVPLSCQFSGNGTDGVCAPEIPFISTCRGDGDCMGGLHCIDLGGRSACTLMCGSSDDCAKNNALSTNFSCAAVPLLNDPTRTISVCAPRIQSGCPASSADSCLSRTFDPTTNNCVSPKGWACNADAQCKSGVCMPVAHSTPQFGRCQ